ncbi:MAG: hypothetical protein NTW52_18010 [Planctomycetota bacterium]|nr:hypothetical protein [Planctomycetota bacterium]
MFDKNRDLVDDNKILSNSLQAVVDERDSILERLVKSVGEECSQEAIEYVANSRAEAVGE